MVPKAPGQPPDPLEHAATGAAVRAPADQPDDAPHAPQHVPVPGVEGDRKGAVQHDGANVLGVPRGVYRHEEGAVGIAPQVQLVETEGHPHGVDVVGDRGRAVKAGVPSQVGAADPRDVREVERQRIVAGEARTPQRPRLPGAAGIDQQQVAVS
jgi:hypothetical protein